MIEKLEKVYKAGKLNEIDLENKRICLKGYQCEGCVFHKANETLDQSCAIEDDNVEILEQDLAQFLETYPEARIIL